MSIQEQMRRGSTAENDAFTGAVAETTYDTDLNEQRNHDGSRQGGFPVPNFSSVQKRSYSYGTAGGTAAAITISTLVDAVALTAGLRVSVKMTNNAISGGTTLQWGSLTAKDIKKWVSGSKEDIEDDDWFSGQIVDFDYDGTDWVLYASGGSTGGLVAEATWSSGSPSTVSFGSGTFVAGKSYHAILTQTAQSSVNIQLRESGGSYLTGSFYDCVSQYWRGDNTNGQSNLNNQSSIAITDVNNVRIDFGIPMEATEYADLSWVAWGTTAATNDQTKLQIGAGCYLYGGFHQIDGVQFTSLSGDGKVQIYED